MVLNFSSPFIIFSPFIWDVFSSRSEQYSCIEPLASHQGDLDQTVDDVCALGADPFRMPFDFELMEILYTVLFATAQTGITRATRFLSDFYPPP